MYIEIKDQIKKVHEEFHIFSNDWQVVTVSYFLKLYKWLLLIFSSPLT